MLLLMKLYEVGDNHGEQCYIFILAIRVVVVVVRSGGGRGGGDACGVSH